MNKVIGPDGKINPAYVAEYADPVPTYDEYCDICGLLRRCQRTNTCMDTYISVCSSCRI